MKKIVMAGAALVLLTGCFGGPVYPKRSPVSGWLFTGVQSADNVTENPVSPKIGKICASALWIPIIPPAPSFAWGSAAAVGAAGPMQKISIVDSDMTGILGIYATHCTIVHDGGEGAAPAAAPGTAPAAGAAPAAGTPIGTAPVTSPPPPAPPPGTPAK